MHVSKEFTGTSVPFHKNILKMAQMLAQNMYCNKNNIMQKTKTKKNPTTKKQKQQQQQQQKTH